jgi:hypothetical protein
MSSGVLRTIKDVSGKAKASTELFGTLATTLGGSAARWIRRTACAANRSRLSVLRSIKSRRCRSVSVQSWPGFRSRVSFHSKSARLSGTSSSRQRRWRRAFNRTKEAAAELNAELSKSRNTAFANQKEDIELIRDPKEKRAAQEALFKQLDNDVQGITRQAQGIRKSSGRMGRRLADYRQPQSLCRRSTEAGRD